jgi:hypothetical protein
MAEALDKIAEKVEVDLTACERRLTGTYQTDLKIVRSHPDIPYTLRLSVGDILETVLVESQVAENLDVKAASSVTLTMPVMSGLACTWLGTVFGPNGPIDPPIIKAAGNTLFWAGVATGTIRAEYASIHDVVTVEIPGIPNYVGSERGEPQESTALAFYHYQVFPCDITPPPDDSDATLAEVCGWYNGPQYGFPEEEAPPEPPPPPEIEYGCITNASFPLLWEVDSPEFYEARCCVPGTPPHGNCRVWSSRLEGGKDLSEETRARMTAAWPGPIEFIGLGPITPEGCGTRYEETRIIQHNCCDVAEPMAWDVDTSVEVLAPGTSGIVGVTGGLGNYYWSVRGVDFWLNPSHTLRDGVTDTPYVWIYAGPNACGYAPIVVTDGCSTVSDGGIRATVGVWATHLFDPVCLIQTNPAEYGVFLCSSYVPGESFLASSFIVGQWWAGVDVQSPPEIGLIGYIRTSYSCGLYVADGGPDLIYVTDPATEGRVSVPALGKMAIGSCNPGSGFIDGLTIYGSTRQWKVAKWIC